MLNELLKRITKNIVFFLNIFLVLNQQPSILFVVHQIQLLVQVQMIKLIGIWMRRHCMTTSKKFLLNFVYQRHWYLGKSDFYIQDEECELISLIIPFSDVNYLSNSAPPAAAEWSSLLRPLRGREPEGMWNLLSIVREMFRRCDRNAIRLLEIITEESLQCDQILIWWFHTKLSMMYGTGMGHVNGGKHGNTHSNTNASQHACSSLCDEIVVLWRLAALNPGKLF